VSPSSAKLLRIVIPVISVVIFQAVLSVGSLELMSAVRAYVGGESFWSKGQKDAIRFIQLYAATGEPVFLQRFDLAIAVPLGDLTARRALEQPSEDVALAREGFLRGGNKQDDVGRLIWLYRYFRAAPYFRDAVAYWRETDATLERLVALRSLVERQSAQGLRDKQVQAWKSEIDSIDQQLVPHAIAFSESLVRGSKSINRLLTAMNLASAVLLIGFIVLRLRRVLAAQMAAQQQLMLEQEKASHTLSSIGEAVIVVSGDGHVTFANPAACRLLRVTDELDRVAATSLFSLQEQQAASPYIATADRGDAEGCVCPSQVLVRADGSSVQVAVSRSELRHAGDGSYVLVIRDMTEERNLLDRIAWQAAHDGLTELANRRQLEFQLEREMPRADAKGTLVLILADLDQFKVVNDTSGHAAGDHLLRHAANLFKEVVGDRGLVARLGGDEFGMLIRVEHSEQAIALAERLRAEIDRIACFYNGTAFRTTASIGLVFTRDVASPADALRAADVACFLAKEKGRNRVQIHRPTDEDIENRIGEMNWVRTIRDGLEHNRFCLFAQEVRALGEGRGQPHFELLLRLRQSDDQLLSPGSFLPAAERYGLMPLIDRWVIRAAFEQIARLGDAEPAVYAINISGVTLGDRKFLNYVADELLRHGIDPACICFEITETSAIANLHEAKFFIEAFHQLGCRFSLDDFGTGMSSIAYLKHLPVEYLKIDGSFVKEMLSSSVDRAMVEMITRTAKILGMKVVAEFVESREILEALRLIGVDYAQGYAIGKPAPFPRLQDSSAGQIRGVA